MCRARPAFAAVALLLSTLVAANCASRSFARTEAATTPERSSCSDTTATAEEQDAWSPPGGKRHDVEPVATNDGEIMELLAESYPDGLKSRGVSGAVVVWIHVDRQGRVDSVRVHRSSGHPEMDETAKKVAREMRFAPGLDEDGEQVSTWISRCVTFSV